MDAGQDRPGRGQLIENGLWARICCMYCGWINLSYHSRPETCTPILQSVQGQGWMGWAMMLRPFRFDSDWLVLLLCPLCCFDVNAFAFRWLSALQQRKQSGLRGRAARPRWRVPCPLARPSHRWPGRC
jgi:hypothetical protein